MDAKLEAIRKAHLVDRLLAELSQEREVRDDWLVRQIRELGEEWRRICHVLSAHVVGVESSLGPGRKRAKSRSPKPSPDGHDGPGMVEKNQELGPGQAHKAAPEDLPASLVPNPE